MADKALSPTLESTASKEQREKYKDQAERVRETGDLDTSLEMFEKVIEWDEANNNLRGKVDVLGHIRICYTRKGDETQDPEEKKNFYKLAMETAEDAIQTGKSISLELGELAVPLIHSASSRVDYARYLDGDAKTEVLKRALQDINSAIENLGGSQAHKAWPANTKAKIEYALGDVSATIKTLTIAEQWVFEGYDEEMASGTNPELKLTVWISGLHLTMAGICAKEGKTFLAQYYARLILAVDDPSNMLGERKKEAQRILESLR